MSDSSTAMDATASTATAPGAGMLIVRDSDLATMQPVGPPQGFVGDDPMGGGVDFSRIWHAFRRRWLSAVVLGTLLASAAAVPTWLFLPHGYEAVSWLRIRDNSGAFSRGRDTNEYDSYRKTQVTLIKSPFLMTSVLRRPGIAELETIREAEEDPVGWLTRSVQVTAPMESEVMQVRLRGQHASDLAKIVNAVTKAYLEDIVQKDRAETLARRDALEKKYKENMTELRERREMFNTLARTLGTRDSHEVSTQRSLLLDHLSSVRAQLTQAQRDIAAIDAELAIRDAMSKVDVAADEAVPDDMLEAELQRDPQIQDLSRRLAALEESILFQKQRSARGANEPAVKRLMVQREELLRQIAERRKEIRPQIGVQMSLKSLNGTSRRSEEVADSPVLLKIRREMLAVTVADLSKEFEKVAKEVTELGKANADLEARRSEMAQLEQVTNALGMQLETSKLDLSMPSRVTLIEEAGVPEGNDKLFRLLATALAGGLGLVLGGGLIVGLEYLRDRLSAADEVSRRIGVRMLGTLPRIGRSRRKSNDGLMTECVDSIRTLVMQSGRQTPRVILVTSAVEHEGKTTFASQLAASIARSDKRTLLLDGDLRHPNVHVALGIDPGVGLSELLRGEITSDEAVQPTSIDGLFTVTGGACDYTAVTALSKPELAKFLKGYRESFDHVVIDAGPVLAFADALLLGQQSDVAIVAAMRDSSRVPLVTAGIDRLRAVGVRVLGVVVSGVVDSGPRPLYHSPLPG
jgi:succinoglycan biosynthesis transport protein ExoP